jgi:hypothetical protein
MDYSDTTVMIPVKNEPAAGQVTREVLRKLPGSKVLVVYKGDRKILNINFKDRRMRMVEQHDSGKGRGVRHALKFVDTEILCLIDGDATYSVDDLKKVIKLVREGADMAIGDRLSRLDRRSMPRFIEFGNKVITVMANLLYGMSLEDSQTGLRAIRKNAISRLELSEPGFGIESELNIRSRKAGFKIAETPIKYSVRVGESKQMKLIDGIKLLLLDFKFLF